MQYSYSSVISGLPLKKVHPFRNFLAVLPPPTLYKVQNHFVGGYRNSTCHASIWNFNIYTLAVFVLEIFNTRFAAPTCTISAASTHA